MAVPGEPSLTETDLARKVMHGSAARAASYLAGSLVTAVGSIFLLRHLGLVDFGRYGTVMALLGIVGGVTEGGLTITATRDMSLLERRDERRDLLRDLLALRLVLSAVGVTSAVGFAVVAGYSDELVLGTLLAGVGILFASAEAALLVPLGVDLRNGRVAVNEFVRQLLLVIGIVVLSLAGAGLGSFFTNQLVAGLALLVVAPLIVGRANVVLPRWNWSRNLVLLRAAAPLAIVSVLGIIYFRVLVLIASVMTDDEQTALFVTSSRVVELLVGVPLLMVGVVLPVLTVAARDNLPRLHYVTQRLTEVAALAGALFFLILLVGAAPILVALGGEEYRPVAPVLQIQSAMMITLFLVSAWNPALIALGRQRAIAVATALGLLAAVVGGLILIPLFEARGAALAAMLAELVNAAAAIVLLRRAGPGRELHYGWVPRVLVALGVGVAVGLFVPGPEWVAPVAGTVAFVAAAFAARVVPPEIMQAARRRR